jgi:hypothetical protein
VWNIQDAFNEAITELEAEGFDCYGDSERQEAWGAGRWGGGYTCKQVSTH